MNNNILIVLIIPFILFSLYLIGRTQIELQGSTKQTRTTKLTPPSPVNINLDSSFNNFKDRSTLTFDTLRCELYDEKNKHVDPLGKANLEQYDGQTTELLLSLIKQINKVKTQKNLLQNIKPAKPSRIVLDTSKLQRLYNNLMKTKDLIDNREGQIKILKQNFKPSVLSGKQFEIDVEKQLIAYLEKRLGYLKSLKPKSIGSNDDFQRVEYTLDVSESTMKTILQQRDENKNKVKSNEEINKLLNLRKYWELRLEEVKQCQTTDEGYRLGQNNDIYRQLQKLGMAQKENWNQGYCMELKKHLILRLVKQFDVIQSDFNCIRDKGRIQSQIKKLDNDIERLRKEDSGANYDPNKHDNELDKLHRNYDNIASNLESQAKKVQTGYDAQTLKDMIQNTEIELNAHRKRLDDLNNGKNSDEGGDDPQKIVNLANQNIKLKADYCKEYEQYERQNQVLRAKLDQISADRSIEHIATQRYITISNQIKNSLNQISKIKDRITGGII